MKPDFIEARSNHATALLELGRMRDGLEALDRVLADDPGHVLSLNNRGNALFALKRYQEAVESYDRALAIHPEFADARQNRLLALGELNRGGPRFVEILRAQGEDMMRRGQYANALKRFDEALAIKPDDPEAIAHRATTLREGFRSLFDECAAEYEESMINSLNYRGHIQVRELADRVWTGAKTGLRVLDIGCGTGLVGDQFKQWTAGGRLDGIDFAPNMLEVARKRAIYHNLILGELEQFLQEDGETYELLVAADTIIYLSDLTPIFTGAAKRLRPGGQFIFSVEAEQRRRLGRNAQTSFPPQRILFARACSAHWIAVRRHNVVDAPVRERYAGRRLHGGRRKTNPLVLRCPRTILRSNARAICNKPDALRKRPICISRFCSPIPCSSSPSTRSR